MKENKDNKENKEFHESIIDISRVTRVVKGGRRMRFRVTVVIGNGKGLVGIGIGKSGEVSTSIQKAVLQAKKNIINIPIVNGTIPFEVSIKYKSSKIILIPAGQGTGIIAGSSIRSIVEVSGIENILSKRFGTGNKLVNAQAAINAFSLLSESYKRYEKDKKERTKEKDKNLTTTNTKELEEDKVLA